MPDTCTIFAPQPDYRAPIEALRLVAEEVEVFGPKSRWTRLEAEVAGGVKLTFTPLEPGGGAGDADAAELLRSTATHFEAIDPADDAAAGAKAELLRRLAAARFVLRVVTDPGVEEAAVPALAAVLRAVDGMLFDGTGMLDADGTTLLDDDGSSGKDEDGG